MKKKWVLKDGENYFKEWTGIGPAATQDIDEAKVFASKEDAMRSPAFTFGLTFYEPTNLNSLKT